MPQIVLHSDSKVQDSTENHRALYSVNCKAALGEVEGGLGVETFNKVMAVLNMPVMCRNTTMRAQKLVGKALVQTADESCKEAIEEEKQITLANRSRCEIQDGDTREAEPSGEVDEPEAMDITPPTTPKHGSRQVGYPQPMDQENEATPDHQDTPRRKRTVSVLESCEPVDITVKYDFGWDKRGSGFKYDSHSGRGSLIGQETNKVLGYDVVSSYCAMCARGLKPENHVCAKNYSGSAKGMEPHSAIKLCIKNNNLNEANVRVSKLVGDRDSSTMAALRRESSHTIEKIIDLNHNTKSINNALWNLKKTTEKWITVEMIESIKRSVNYAIKQGEKNVEKVKNGIMNIVNHNFGEHNACGEWCKAKEDPDTYIYKSLPGGKPFCEENRPGWRQKLSGILQAQADDAVRLAPAGSTLQNESFNHMCNTRAPKSRHYCGTEANFLRVSAAVSCKNLGMDKYIGRVLQKALLSPSRTDYLRKMQRKRVIKAQYQNLTETKKKRLFLKMKNKRKESSSARAEGYTYVSGMSSTMERAAAAASSTWIPDPTALQKECTTVVVDIETTGLHATAEIVQIAGKCGNEEFSRYILPKKKFNSEASAVTGLKVVEGQLFHHDKPVQTVPPKKAAEDFIFFLQKCSKQVILVGHNIVRFDAPRIVKFMNECEQVKHFYGTVFGLVDTLPLLKQGKLQKQEVLAATFLKGPRWNTIIKSAHDALADCILLDGLLNHFKFTADKLKESVLPMRDFFERQQQLKKKKDNTPALMVFAKFGVSLTMVGRMAATGVTVQALEEEYLQHGRKGLNICLGVQLNGKPRVTKSNKILDKVEACVKSRLLGLMSNNPTDS